MKTTSVLAVLILGAVAVALPNPVFASPAAPLSSPVVALDDATREKVAELCRTAAEKRRAGDLEAASASCRTALFLEKKSPDVYAELAEIAIVKGDTAEAAKNFRLSIGAEPGQLWGATRMDDGDLHLRYALFLLKNGSIADAVEMYKEALDRMPDDEKKMVPGKFDAKNVTANPADRQKFETAARTALGLRLMALEATDDAATQFETVLKMTPTCAAAQYGLGNIYRMKGNKGEAMVALQKAADSGDGAVRDLAKKAMEDNR